MSAADTILQALTQHHHREPHPRTAAVETLADYDAVRDGRLRDFAPVFTTSDGSDVPATELRNSVCGCLIQGVGPHTLLNLAELAEKHECQGDGSVPDFFKPGRTYAKGQDGYKAPEQTWQFRCVAVAEHPREEAGRRAFGFMRQGLGPWESAGVREGEYERGWVDVTEGGAADV